MWDPIEHTVLCEATLEEEEDEETGEPVYAVACVLPPFDFVQFPSGPVRRGMIEVSMNNSDFPEKEEYEDGLPVEFRIFDNSIQPIPSGSRFSVCVRRPNQDAERTTKSITVSLATPLPEIVELDEDAVCARLQVDGSTLDLESDVCVLEERTSVTVDVPESLLIPDGSLEALISVSVNGGEEYSNAVPVRMYAGLVGVVSRDLSGLPNLPEPTAADLEQYEQFPAVVSAEGGVPVSIFPHHRQASWIVEGATPTVQFIDYANDRVIAAIDDAKVDVERGCVVVTVPPLPEDLQAPFDAVEVGEVAPPVIISVRVAMNGADFLDSENPTAATHGVQYYAKPHVREAQLWLGPDPVEVARIEAEKEAKRLAQEALSDEEKAAQAEAAKKAAKAAKSKKGKKGAVEEEVVEEKAPIVPVSVRLEGKHFTDRGSEDNGAGIVVRFSRSSDGAITTARGKINHEDHSIECDPPQFPEKPAVESKADDANEDGEEAEEAVADKVMAAVSLNGGQQFSEAVELITVDYDEAAE